MSIHWGNRGHCPKCGKFCGNIKGLASEMALLQVVGRCAIHGDVDLTGQDWTHDEFYNGDRLEEGDGRAN